jgi:uncharacterized DUF497 family protein
MSRFEPGRKVEYPRAGAKGEARGPGLRAAGGAWRQAVHSRMQFVWDEAKRRANLRKHFIDFIDAAEVFRGPVVSREDNDLDYGETRFSTIGMVRGRVIVVVHTQSESTIRLSSARRSTRNEQIRYWSIFAD